MLLHTQPTVAPPREDPLHDCWNRGWNPPLGLPSCLFPSLLQDWLHLCVQICFATQFLACLVRIALGMHVGGGGGGGL